MKILRNYILQECILPFFLALLVLTFVFLLGNLIQLAHLVINKGVSITTVGKVFLLYIPVLLGYTLPLACLIGVILAFSRLSADNEILAIRTNGINLKVLLFPLILIGIILSLFSLLLNDRIIPQAHHEQRRLLKTLAKNPTALLEPGSFINSFDNQILFIYKIEGHKLYNITIHQPQPEGRPTRTILANKGEFTQVPGKDQIVLKLMEGTSDEPDKNNPNNFYKLNFDNFFMTLNLTKDNVKVDKKPKSMSLRELLKEKEEWEKHFFNTARLDTEFYRKINWSLSALVFILLGFPLAVITNKREKTANVVMAILAAATYYLFTLGCEALSLENIVPAVIIMWVPNILCGLLAVFFNYKLTIT